MISKFALPDIEYRAAPLPATLDLFMLQRKFTLALPQAHTRLKVPGSLAAKAQRARKGYLRMRESNELLSAESLAGLDFYDQMSTQELIEEGGQVVKLVDEPSRMVPQLKALREGTERLNYSPQEQLRVIRQNHTRAFLGPSFLCFVQPLFTVVLKQVQKIKVAQDDFLSQALNGSGPAQGLLCMDSKNRLLLCPLAPREQTLGIWLRNGSDSDLLHLLLEYIISPLFSSRFEARKGHLIVFRMSFSGRPEIYLAQPLPGRWGHHMVGLPGAGDVDVVLSAESLSPVRWVRLEFQEDEPRQSVYLGEEQERTVKQQLGQVSLKSSIEVGPQLKYEDLKQIIESQSRMIKDLQAQNEHLLQIIFKQSKLAQDDLRLNLACSRYGSSKRHSRDADNFDDSDPAPKLARFSSCKEGSATKSAIPRDWIKRSNHEFTSGSVVPASAGLPRHSDSKRRQNTDVMRTRLNFQERRSQADLTAYEYTLSKKDREEEECHSIRQELSEIGLDLSAQQTKQGWKETRDSQFTNPSFLKTETRPDSKAPAACPPPFLEDFKPRVQAQPPPPEPPREQPRIQVVFPPRETPSLESISGGYSDRLSLGFLESFRKERGLKLPQRGGVEDSDESDSQIKKISTRY